MLVPAPATTLESIQQISALCSYGLYFWLLMPGEPWVARPASILMPHGMGPNHMPALRVSGHVLSAVALAKLPMMLMLDPDARTCGSPPHPLFREAGPHCYGVAGPLLCAPALGETVGEGVAVWWKAVSSHF